VKNIVSPMKITDDNICFMSENDPADELDLVDFLNKDMKNKGVTAADVTRRTGLSPSQISKILNRESPAGVKALDCFAVALNLPKETLYQIAGRLSKPKNDDQKRQELNHLFDMMTEGNQDDQIAYARMKLQMQEREDKNKKNGKGNRPSKDL
jgi:transcriptional regulator with XRE-family HTH domain